MKKNLLTLAFCSCMIAAGAQNARTLETNVLHKSEAVPAMTKVTKAQKLDSKDYSVSQSMNAVSVMNRAKKNVVTRAESPLSVFYMAPFGTLYGGVSPNGRVYSRLLMFTPAFTDITFPGIARSTDTTTPIEVQWTYPGTASDGSDSTIVMKTDENGYGVGSMFGSVEAPTLTAKQGTYTASYQMLDNSDKAAFWLGGTDSLTSLSAASYAMGFYGGFTNGPSFTTNELFFETGKKCVGFVQTMDKPIDSLYVENGFIILGTDADKVENILEGKTLTLTLCKVENENLVPYATATATDENVTWLGKGMLSIVFPFMEEDPLFGSVASPIMVKDATYIIIEGFDQISTPVQALFASAGGFDGNGYALLEDGGLSTVGYSDDPEIPQVNLHIGLTGAIPVAEPYDPSQTVFFPVEGGAGVTGFNAEANKAYNDYDILTLSSGEQWLLEEAPEWVTGIEFDNTYVERGTIMFFFSADPLPAGETHRSGNIVLSLYGKRVTIPVLQGEDPSAIDNIKTENNSNSPVYNLMGQKVSASAKGLLIRDGKKFINK